MSAASTFLQLRLVDRVGRGDLSRGATSLLSLIIRRRRGKWLQCAGHVLAVMLNASRRSVCRWLSELEDMGLITIWRRSRIVNGVRVSVANSYAVNDQALVDLAANDFEARAAMVSASLAAAVRRRVDRWASMCAKLARYKAQEKEKDAENESATEWAMGDIGPDGRKIVGKRQFGSILVPIWS